MNSIQRWIEPLKPTNRIQCQFHSKTDSILNHQIGFNVNSIQSQIQPLNPQIGFIMNSIQRRIQPLNLQIGFNVSSISRQIQPLNP